MVESQSGLMAFGLLRHCWPLFLDRGLEVADKRLLQVGGFRFLARGITKKGRRCACFVGDNVLGFVEFFPDDDHGEGQEHRIDDADRRELESRDFVVFRELLKAKFAAD